MMISIIKRLSGVFYSINLYWYKSITRSESITYNLIRTTELLDIFLSRRIGTSICKESYKIKKTAGKSHLILFLEVKVQARILKIKRHYKVPYF